MEGTRFGRLVVVGLHSKDANYNKRWECVCDCGNSHVVLAMKLKDGSVKSCGCLGRDTRYVRSEQAALDRREMARRTRVAMLKRCHQPTHNKFYAYGARGITVCDRWRFGEDGKTGFECFFQDMGPKPVGCTIDRIDNTKGYVPDNCRWATATAQARNTSRVFKVHCDGEFLPWLDVMERLGLEALLARVNANPTIVRDKIKALLQSIT
jgi:hypothetical protein